jgi:hypothetical protein
MPVTTRIKEMFSPHMEGIHCMAHDFMNLVIHTLAHLFVTSKIEFFLQFFFPPIIKNVITSLSSFQS